MPHFKSYKILVTVATDEINSFVKNQNKLKTMTPSKLTFLPCLDSPEMAHKRRIELDISRDTAIYLGKTAVEICQQGFYINDGQKIDLSKLIQIACDRKVSIRPEDTLPESPQKVSFSETVIQVTNETTMQAAQRLINAGNDDVLALNFANGIHPGGGFLHGARAQEESICRSSALYATLNGDHMYEAHKIRPLPDSTDWCIYSPLVPMFRNDKGEFLPTPWLLNFITSAAPYVPTVGQMESAQLLRKRIHRVLAIARAYQHTTLVLGAWGCGAFGNDSLQTAKDFRNSLENEFNGAFKHIVFAITDWSPERKFLTPFQDAFSNR